MNYLPGDTYIYESFSNNNQVIIVRTDEDRWAVLPDNGYPVSDGDMSYHFDMVASGVVHMNRAIFARRGVDILSDMLLGYGDNIQF